MSDYILKYNNSDGQWCHTSPDLRVNTFTLLAALNLRLRHLHFLGSSIINFLKKTVVFYERLTLTR